MPPRCSQKKRRGTAIFPRVHVCPCLDQVDGQGEMSGFSGKVRAVKPPSPAIDALAPLFSRILATRECPLPAAIMSEVLPWGSTWLILIDLLKSRAMVRSVNPWYAEVQVGPLRAPKNWWLFFKGRSD